jgi:hypothetical protein
LAEDTLVEEKGREMNGGVRGMHSHGQELLTDVFDAPSLLGPVETAPWDQEREERAAAVRVERPKPAWWLLYAVVPLTALLFMLADLLSPTSGWRSTSELLAALVVLWAIGLWLRANRVALALSGEASNAGRPLRAWVAYCPPPTTRRKLDLPEIKHIQRLAIHTEQMREENVTCCAK